MAKKEDIRKLEENWKQLNEEDKEGVLAQLCLLPPPGVPPEEENLAFRFIGC